VNGQAWPVLDGETVWLPAGAHAIESSARSLPLTVSRFSGAIHGASAGKDGRVEVSYSSSSRAIAVLSARPARVEIDGVEQALTLAGDRALLLPRGQHIAAIFPSRP
jgi:hypothetical protein